jgi:hypothetical protein
MSSPSPLADVAFDPTRPSLRWLLLLSLLAHALVLAGLLLAQLQPVRLHVAPRSGISCPLLPPQRQIPVCRTWRNIGDTGPACASYFQVSSDLVRFVCSELSPELRAALRSWPYRADPCGDASGPL